MTRSATRQTPGRTCLQGSYHLVWIRIQLQSAKGPSVDRSNITKQMILPKWTEWWTSILTIFTIYVCWPQAKSRGDSLKYQNLYQKISYLGERKSRNNTYFWCELWGTRVLWKTCLDQQCELSMARPTMASDILHQPIQKWPHHFQKRNVNEQNLQPPRIHTFTYIL